MLSPQYKRWKSFWHLHERAYRVCRTSHHATVTPMMYENSANKKPRCLLKDFLAPHLKFEVVLFRHHWYFFFFSAIPQLTTGSASPRCHVISLVTRPSRRWSMLLAWCCLCVPGVDVELLAVPRLWLANLRWGDHGRLDARWLQPQLLLPLLLHFLCSLPQRRSQPARTRLQVGSATDEQRGQQYSINYGSLWKHTDSTPSLRSKKVKVLKWGKKWRLEKFYIIDQLILSTNKVNMGKYWSWGKIIK